MKDDKPKCGCGRSPSGYCVGWHALSEEEYKNKKIEYQKKSLTNNHQTGTVVRRFQRRYLEIIGGFNKYI